MRKFNVTVNGKSYVVEVEEASADYTVAPAPESPAPAPAQKQEAPAGGTIVKAPVQGNVLKLAVANGASVKRGDTIVVIEAMKMENNIVAPVDGTITLLVKQGDAVANGAPLASIK